MRYLLDTYVLLWITIEHPKLSAKAKSIYLNEINEIYLSIASIWEMAIKLNLKKLNLEDPLDIFIKKYIKGGNVKILQIEIPEILKTEHLPLYHRDPFDRMIISQGIVHNISIVTRDQNFTPYPVATIW